MPRVELNFLRAAAVLTDHRFVRPDYDHATRMFAEIIDPHVIANMKLQLDLHAGYCELAHTKDCGCNARDVNQTAERTMLVLHESRTDSR
jgi:hypothetical protein